MILASFNSSDGTAHGSRYIQSSTSGSINLNEVNGIVYYNNYLYMFGISGVIEYLIIYNVISPTFKYYSSTNLLTSSANYESSTQRLIILGYSSSSGYISKVNQNLIDYLRDFTITSTISMSILSSFEYNIVSDYTLPSPLSPTVAITDTTASVILSPAAGSQTLDSNTIISVNIQDQSYLDLLEQYSIKLTPSVS